MPRKNKYNATKYICGEERFDSKKEYTRWLQLLKMYEAGEIFMLERQVEFELIPRYVIDKKVVERAVKYKADFVYHQNGRTVVEDVKGYKKGAAYNIFVIKRKLMLYRYGIQVKEI